MSPEPDAAHVAPVAPHVEEMDLRQLVRALWHHRRAVILLGILGGLIGVFYGYQNTKWVSNGLLLATYVDMKAYKQYEAALASESRLEAFIEASSLDGKPTAATLRGIVTDSAALAKAVRPAFQITGREAKIYDIEAKATGNLIGFNLLVERKARTEDSPIRSLADYVRDTIIEVDMRSRILDQCLKLQTREQELRNDQLASDFVVLQARERAAQLRKLIADVPGASQVDNRQVVSVENGGERYLSPTAQLVAVELQIGDAELASVARERERIASVLKRDYYCGALELQKSPHTGAEFFERLAAVQQRAFDGQDMSKEIVEHSANQLELERQGWVSQYFARTRFVVPPEGAEQKVRKPGMTISGLVGGILGGLLGVLIALALAWWHDNRDVVLAPED